MRVTLAAPPPHGSPVARDQGHLHQRGRGHRHPPHAARGRAGDLAAAAAFTLLGAARAALRTRSRTRSRALRSRCRRACTQSSAACARKPDDTVWQAIDLPTGFVASVSLTEADTLLVEAGDPFAVGARFEAMGAIGRPTKVATLLSRRHFGDPAGVSELRSTLRSVVNDKEESLRFSNLVTVDVPASPTAAVASARTLEARTYFVAGSGGRRSYLLTAWVSSPLEVGRCERAPCDADGRIRFDCPPPRCAASLADVPADPVAVAIVDSFRLTPNGDAARDEKLSRLGFFAEPQSPDAARSQFPSAALN